MTFLHDILAQNFLVRYLRVSATIASRKAVSCSMERVPNSLSFWHTSRNLFNPSLERGPTEGIRQRGVLCCCGQDVYTAKSPTRPEFSAVRHHGGTRILTHADSGQRIFKNSSFCSVMHLKHHRRCRTVCTRTHACTGTCACAQLSGQVFAMQGGALSHPESLISSNSS